MVKSKLVVLGIERELLWTSLQYHRFFGVSGRPTSKVLGGLISATFLSQTGDDELLNWLTHVPEKEICTFTEGKIIFYGGDLDEQTLFEYKFNDAALVHWNEQFTANETSPMTVTISISAAIQEIKNVSHIKTWQKSGIPPSNQATTNQEEEDTTPKLIDFFLTDEEGIRIDEYSIGDTIILNIITENRIGENLTINLGDATHDFEYQESVLYNDTIENFTISQDEHKLSLKVLEQRE